MTDRTKDDEMLYEGEAVSIVKDNKLELADDEYPIVVIVQIPNGAVRFKVNGRAAKWINPAEIDVLVNNLRNALESAVKLSIHEPKGKPPKEYTNVPKVPKAKMAIKVRARKESDPCVVLSVVDQRDNFLCEVNGSYVARMGDGEFSELMQHVQEAMERTRRTVLDMTKDESRPS